MRERLHEFRCLWGLDRFSGTWEGKEEVCARDLRRAKNVAESVYFPR